MQDEKSQLQNRERAMKVLRARLYDAKLAEQQAELAAARSAQVGTGERAEKIRTYNFPERRVTDHRIKLTAHNLDQLLAGRARRVHRRAPGRREAPPARRRRAPEQGLDPIGAGRRGCRCCGTDPPESDAALRDQRAAARPRFGDGLGRHRPAYVLGGVGRATALAGGALVFDVEVGAQRGPRAVHREERRRPTGVG